MNWAKEIFFIWRAEGLGWDWYEIMLFAFVATYLLTPICRSLAFRFKVLDYPSKRKVHQVPTPRLGGVAIYLGFLFAIFMNFHFSDPLKGVLIASTLMFVVGLIDDLRGLSALWRLIAQFIAVTILIQFGVFINLFPEGPLFNLIEFILTFFWVVGITNAFNFMDGLDGLATGLGFVTSLAFFFIAQASGQSHLSFLGVAMAGACLGFLKFNFPKASIFMGDSGSTFIGFFLASLAMMGEWSEGNLLISISCPILILALLIYDMIYITIARVWTGKVRNFKEWLEYVGKDHMHHRLLALGFKPTQVVGMMCFISMVLVISAIKIRTASLEILQLEYLQVTSILVFISILIIAGKKNRSHLKM